MENTVKSGRYWIVLESATDSKNDVLLLHKDHKADYFSSGVLLVVNPTGQITKEQIMNSFKARRMSLEKVELEAIENISGITCYGFKRLVMDAASEYSEQVSDCADQADKSDG